MIIRKYEDKDELGWVRCRVLSFLDSAYFDNVLQKKEHYNNPSLELVADSKISRLFLVNSFAHYVGENTEEIKEQFKRVHECNLYELII